MQGSSYICIKCTLTDSNYMMLLMIMEHKNNIFTTRAISQVASHCSHCSSLIACPDSPHHVSETQLFVFFHTDDSSPKPFISYQQTNRLMRQQPLHLLLRLCRCQALTSLWLMQEAAPLQVQASATPTLFDKQVHRSAFSECACEVQSAAGTFPSTPNIGVSLRRANDCAACEFVPHQQSRSSVHRDHTGKHGSVCEPH